MLLNTMCTQVVQHIRDTRTEDLCKFFVVATLGWDRVVHISPQYPDLPSPPPNNNNDDDEQQPELKIQYPPTPDGCYWKTQLDYVAVRIQMSEGLNVSPFSFQRTSNHKPIMDATISHGTGKLRHLIFNVDACVKADKTIKRQLRTLHEQFGNKEWAKLNVTVTAELRVLKTLCHMENGRVDAQEPLVFTTHVQLIKHWSSEARTRFNLTGVLNRHLLTALDAASLSVLKKKKKPAPLLRENATLTTVVHSHNK